MDVGPSRYWMRFPQTYRAQEMQMIIDWLAAGESGTIVGLAGMGRATLLSFLCQRADVAQSYLPSYARPILFVPVDLNNMPDNRLVTLHRIILRAFYEIRGRCKPSIQQTIIGLYEKYEAARDAFLTQMALRELLLLFQDQEIRLVLVMNRFDRFCQRATPQMTASLRGLRDGFKDTLGFLMGMSQALVYLSDLDSIRPLRGILDSQLCWIGPLNETDARHMVANETRHLDKPLPEVDVVQILELSGGYPSLIRVICHWWMDQGGITAVTNWSEMLLSKQNVQHRLQEIWTGLTQEEQALLAKMQKLQDGSHSKSVRQNLARQNEAEFRLLVEKGICRQTKDGWGMTAALMNEFVSSVKEDSRGKIWLDEETEEIYQGSDLVTEFKPLERDVLKFLLGHPRKRHTHTDIIEAAWPETVQKEVVSTEARLCKLSEVFSSSWIELADCMINNGLLPLQ